MHVRKQNAVTVLEWLDRIHPQDRFVVGDKAFYLGQLLQRGYPVIPGFVVRSSILRNFLAEIDWLEPLFSDLSDSTLHLDVNNPRQLQAIAQRIRDSIQTAPLPPDWLASFSEAAEELSRQTELSTFILRPSLALQTSRPDNHAFNPEPYATSGLWQSHICSDPVTSLEAGIKKVWAELFRARSLLYWQRCGVKLHQIYLAVLIQPIANAKASGTLNATTDTFEIQATWGLGMSLVKGEVLPDLYRIQAETGTLQDTHLGEKTILYDLAAEALHPQNPLQTQALAESLSTQAVLGDRELQQLVHLAQQLKSNIASPYTLEWTIAQPQSTLYLTQVEVQPLPVQHPLALKPPSLEVSVPFLRGLAAAPGQVQTRATAIGPTQTLTEPIVPGRILVVSAIAPEHLPLLQQAAGIIAEQGSLTSHGAIVARELGIPAIVSVQGATRLIQSGEVIFMDGSTGEIYRRDAPAIAPLPRPQPLATPHSYRTSTQLMVNLSQSTSIERAQALPVDGVGLLRSELMVPEILDGLSPWDWLHQGRGAEFAERLQQQIARFASAFAPRPVFYRALDLNINPEGEPLPASQNAMLGLRGTFNCLLNPDLFDLELRAIAQVHQQGLHNVHPILPFVRTVEEFVFCRNRLPLAGLDPERLQLWIMAEVPSILFLLPEYVQAGVRGISIGTNDLSQLLLGIDRNLGVLASAFDGLHPAVLRAIQQLIQTARTCGIPCSICGQAPSLYPELVDLLVQWGISAISVDLQAVPTTLEAIAQAEQRIVLEATRRQLRPED
ncbi:putative PEP-binding protein [Desertifilum tharense IPPAS B-1220]|nr:putative PEP-binding protein [Desertifilum tharense]